MINYELLIEWPCKMTVFMKAIQFNSKQNARLLSWLLCNEVLKLRNANF